MKKITLFCCKDVYKMFDGFCVQKGMIYGFIDGVNVVSNGLNYHNINGDYVYLYVLDGDNWQHKKCYNSIIISKINKIVRNNNNKGIQLQYHTSVQLESAHWDKIGYCTEFQQKVPFKTSQRVEPKNAKGAAVFNAAKERKTITDFVNYVVYPQVGEIV